MDQWTIVRGWKGQKLGRIRAIIRDTLGNPLDQRFWVVEGREQELFSDATEATRALLEPAGIRYQVKTMMSHLYWDGTGGWTTRKRGKVYQTRDEALLAVAALDWDKRTWDRVICAEWELANWR